MKKCSGCGKEFSDQAFFCDACGSKLTEIASPAASIPVQEATGNLSAEPARYPRTEEETGRKYKGDFTTAPTGINVISVIGFVLSFLCIGFVWINELSIIIFPLAIVALVLCTIVKAMKYNNLFAKIGFIVALIVTIIAAIVFGIYFYETVF